MSVSLVQRLFSFVDNVWSFILTLVHSLLALFSFRRRSSDPFTLPGVRNRTPKDALARAHSRLRPILLTPRSIGRSPAHYAPRVQSLRTGSATSTLFPGHENATASGSAPQASDPPQRTSPKLDPTDAELGLSAAAPVASDPSAGGSTTDSREGTPDTSLPTTHTASLSVPPLTPPDRCYLAPIPSITDCPYTESWPTDTSLDCGKLRRPGSPLKASINTDTAFVEPMVGPIGSPPPAHWSPSQMWTSTPCKSDDSVPDPVLSPFDQHTGSILEPSSALANISHALISRSRTSIKPYDDASSSSASSDASLFVNASNGLVAGTLQRPDRTHAQALRSNDLRYPQFHRPEPYARVWRHPGARLPGKPDRAARRPFSHAGLPAREWYNADAYVPSPVSTLSPPRCESATEDEDEDVMPLVDLRERLARRSVSHTFGLSIDAQIRMNAAMSPRTRRMSEGCLLAISESTPTRVGVDASSHRRVIALALDGDAHGYKDWLEALSLRFSSEQKDTLTPAREPCVAATPSADGVAA